jgi:hypothetical protein
MYVCMYVRMYVCIMYVCLYVCMYVRMYVCMYACITYVCMYVCTYVFMYVCMHYVCMYVCMYVCTYVRMYVCMYALCMYVCMYVRLLYSHIYRFTGIISSRLTAFPKKSEYEDCAVTPCILVARYKHFGGSCRLDLRDKTSLALKFKPLVSSGCLWGAVKLDGDVSQNTETFKVNVVRNLNSSTTNYTRNNANWPTSGVTFHIT